MTIARKYQISIEDTSFYHVMTRCVRRAFLCGKDKYSGNCYEHRRGMIVDRIKLLAEIFNISVCSYAVMSNHYHLVLKINSTEDWDEKRVLIQWSSLCSIIPLCQRFLNGDELSKAELNMVYLKTDDYRKRLMSISWFMKMLNEYISRICNKEDDAKGHFYDLHPCKSPFRPPVAFKFDPIKFSGKHASKANHCLMNELLILVLT